MKPQQPSNVPPLRTVLDTVQAHLRCARTGLPILTTIAVAIASSVVLTLGG